jgi:hypothetical protein
MDDRAKELCAALCSEVSRFLGDPDTYQDGSICALVARWRDTAADVDEDAPEVSAELREHAARLDTSRRALALRVLALRDEQTQHECEELCHTVQRVVGEIRNRTPRLRALATRLEDNPSVTTEGRARWLRLSAIAAELRSDADGLDSSRRALTARADATLSPTVPIDVEPIR